MEPRELYEVLLELARETDLPVQRLGARAVFDGLTPSSSGVCKLRGEVRVLLADSDPLPDRIQVLARALADGRAAQLEGRFLPPAVRECLEQAGASPGET